MRDKMRLSPSRQEFFKNLKESILEVNLHKAGLLKLKSAGELFGELNNNRKSKTKQE